MAQFDEVQWQTDVGYDVGFASTGGPQRQTQVILMNSNAEARNARWTNSRRKWDVVAGKISLDTGNNIVRFFEARNGRLIGFRFQDPLDWMSCLPGDYNNPGVPAFNDQQIGVGDGSTTEFQLSKTYASGVSSYVRAIYKPQEGTVLTGVNGIKSTPGSFSVNYTTGIVTFVSAPPAHDPVTAGFKFDCGVRFDTDQLNFNFTDPTACIIQSLPIIELPESELAAG